MQHQQQPTRPGALKFRTLKGGIFLRRSGERRFKVAGAQHRRKQRVRHLGANRISQGPGAQQFSDQPLRVNATERRFQA